jgi:polyvinyl alcohol dehydrogenase (cytochrome)
LPPRDPSFPPVAPGGWFVLKSGPTMPEPKTTEARAATAFMRDLIAYATQPRRARAKHVVAIAAWTLACGKSAPLASSPSATSDASPDALPAAPLVVPAVPQPNCSADAGDWPMFGQNVCNTSAPLYAGAITKDNVGKLKTKWVFDAAGDVSATPAVVGGYVYVPDWGGMINKIDATTGKVVWSKNVGELLLQADGGPALDVILQSADGGAGAAGFISRTTPIVTGGLVIFGTQRQSPFTTLGPNAFLVALDQNTAAVKWITELESHPAAIITSSPVLEGSRLYVGVASLEEVFVTAAASYTCCSFRGSEVAVDVATGSVAWKTYTITDALYYAPDGGSSEAGAVDGGSDVGEPAGLSGYAGGSIWSSTAVVDRKRQQLYVTTGNNYNVAPGDVEAGVVPGNYVDSVLALDLVTGAIKWGRSVPQGGQDVWTFQDPAGPDSDFGCGANLFTATIKGTPKDLVGAGQKSGVYWAFDPDTGATVWQQQVGPGGHLGGIHWGTATDGIRVYAGVNDENGTAFTLGGQGPQAGQQTRTGAWAALNPATGDIVWQIANPALLDGGLNGGSVNGPLVVVNGVLFAGSMDAAGTMFAFDAATGSVLWSFQSGATVYGSPAVVAGVVYWGAGYPSRLGFGSSIKKLYAFEVGD